MSTSVNNGDDVSGKKVYRRTKREVKNLRFLVDFMDETQMTTTDLASKIGLSRQSVFLWIRKDNCKMSSLYELFDKCGYNLTVSLDKSGKKETQYVDWEIGVTTPPGEKRLSFLADAIEKYRIFKVDIANKVDVTPSTLYMWFKNDDCFIDQIVQIAECFGLELKFKYTLK